MSKLSPKPQPHSDKKGWKELDILLQSNFKNKHESNRFRPSININEYSMSVEEIKHEAEKQGYSVEQSGDYLKFS